MPVPLVCFSDALILSTRALGRSGHVVAAVAAARRIASESPVLVASVRDTIFSSSESLVSHVSRLLSESGLDDGGAISPAPAPDLVEKAGSSDPCESWALLELLSSVTSIAGSPLRACAALLTCRPVFVVGSTASLLDSALRSLWQDSLQRLDLELYCMLAKCGKEHSNGNSDSLVAVGMRRLTAIAQRASIELRELDGSVDHKRETVSGAAGELQHVEQNSPITGVGAQEAPNDGAVAVEVIVPAAAAPVTSTATRATHVNEPAPRVRGGHEWYRLASQSSPAVILFRIAAAAAQAGVFDCAASWMYQVGYYFP